MAHITHFSIGSNSPNAAKMVQRAIGELLKLESAVELGRGGVYETEPQGKKDQPWFVNSAIALELQMTPEQTLRQVKLIEAKLGREPGQRWGERKIDIDIVFYDDLIMNTAELTIPHPLAASRRFVLAPMVDIDPGLVHPGLGKTVAKLFEGLDEEGQMIRRLET